MWEGRKGKMLGEARERTSKVGKEERKEGECKVKWMDRAMRKTAKCE